MSWDSSVNKVTGHGLDNQRLNLGMDRNLPLLSPSSPQSWSGCCVHTSSVSYWNSSPGVKQPVCETDHSTPASTKVKNAWILPPLPIHFHGLDLCTRQTIPHFIYDKSLKFLLVLRFHCKYCTHYFNPDVLLHVPPISSSLLAVSEKTDNFSLSFV
jgi:hypothetical protein